jgi:hypothetical protein
MFTFCKGKDKIATFGISILWPRQHTLCAEVDFFLVFVFISHPKIPVFFTMNHDFHLLSEAHFFLVNNLMELEGGTV